SAILWDESGRGTRFSPRPHPRAGRLERVGAKLELAAAAVARAAAALEVGRRGQFTFCRSRKASNTQFLSAAKRKLSPALTRGPPPAWSPRAISHRQRRAGLLGNHVLGVPVGPVRVVLAGQLLVLAMRHRRALQRGGKLARRGERSGRRVDPSRQPRRDF